MHRIKTCGIWPPAPLCATFCQVMMKSTVYFGYSVPSGKGLTPGDLHVYATVMSGTQVAPSEMACPAQIMHLTWSSWSLHPMICMG